MRFNFFDKCVYIQISSIIYTLLFCLCVDSVQSSVVDEDGLRHVLLCRVILGNSELVHPGSKQCYPSSMYTLTHSWP